MSLYNQENKTDEFVKEAELVGGLDKKIRDYIIFTFDMLDIEKVLIQQWG